MFKVKQFSKFLTSAINPVHNFNGYTRIFIIDTSSNCGIRTSLNIPRNFYSNKCKDKDGSNKVCDDKRHKEKTSIQTHPSPGKYQDSCPDSLKLKECKPVDINPCKPPPDAYRSKIPSIQDCPSLNLFSQVPTPQCAWDEENAKNRSRNRRILLLGLLVTAVTIGTIWYMKLMDYKPEHIVLEDEKKKKKRQVIRIPAKSEEIPKDVPYLLIGGGTASFSAFRAIKSADPTAKVLVITDESYYPYMRPPLSKEIWFNDDKEAVKNLIFKQWNGSERSLYYEPDDFYTECRYLMDSPNGGVAIARGWTITHLDVMERLAYLDDGSSIHYQKCLIATGATPRTSTVFKIASQDEKLSEKIKLYRNIDDFEEVLDAYEDSKSIAIVGGGFLGSELACAMGRKDKFGQKKIYQIFREDGNMGRILPEYLSNWTTKKVKSEGVTVMPKSDVVGVKESRGGLEMTLNNGHTVTVDNVIVTIGVEPNTQLAEKSDLEVDPELGGYLVNTELQARTDLYIAGDCACFYDPRLGRRRIEHHDHAVVSGRLAGENMTGARKPYYHQSMFWSDLGPDIGYEAIGIVDSSLPTVGIFAKATDQDSPKAVVDATGEGIRSTTEEIPKTCDRFLTDDQKKEVEESRKALTAGEDYGKGVIFYLRNDIVVGIVLWNVFNRMSVARQVLKDQRKYDDLNEVAKLFNIHEE